MANTKTEKRQLLLGLLSHSRTIETVNESTAERQKILELFTNNKQTEWRNRLIWGDKKYVLPSLLPEFAGKVNLIYIDPPFNVGADFSFTATIPDNPETDEDETIEFVKQPSIIEQKAYRDTWSVSKEERAEAFNKLKNIYCGFMKLLLFLVNYLQMMVVFMFIWTGILVIMLRVVLDEVFGYENFRNEIIWHYRGGIKN